MMSAGLMALARVFWWKRIRDVEMSKTKISEYSAWSPSLSPSACHCVLPVPAATGRFNDEHVARSDGDRELATDVFHFVAAASQ